MSGAHARTRRTATSRPRGKAASGESALAVAIVWAASRVLLLGVLVVVVSRSRPLREALSGWDAAVYSRLASDGYTQPNDIAFFPGLPLLLRGLQRFGLSPAVGGALLGVVCSALAAWALYRLGARGWGFGKRHQPVTGAIAASLWLLAPTTVFTTVAYTEAPFCAAAFWSWERAREKQWGQAAVLAAIACSLRVSGLFLIAALVVLAVIGNGDDRVLDEPLGARVRDACWMIVPAAVIAAYVIYLHDQTGSWRAWLDAQEQGWNRSFTDPITALKHTWQATDPARWAGRELVAPVFFFEIVSMLVGVVTTLVCAARRRWAEATWVGLQVAALGTSYWFMSVNRAVLLWFPFFLMVAAVLGRPFQGRQAGRSTAALVTGVVAALSTVAAVFWAWLFYSGQWAS